MKFTVVTAAALLMAAQAQGKSGTARQLKVYSDNIIAVPIVVMGQAIAVAADMFARIGVTLNWKLGLPSPSESAPIIVEFVGSTPASLLPGAWAYALPYEGVHIRIFWDRLQRERSPERLLAHVLVHEITHILQGVDRHSAEGIMNLRWTDDERLALERRPLGFTEEDVDLIYRGMDARGARGPKAAGLALAAMPLKVASISAVQ